MDADEKRIADQLFEAAILVEYANTGKKKSIPDIKMYQNCSKELAIIAMAIDRIRKIGYGIDVEPNQYTK